MSDDRQLLWDMYRQATAQVEAIEEVMEAEYAQGIRLLNPRIRQHIIDVWGYALEMRYRLAMRLTGSKTARNKRYRNLLDIPATRLPKQLPADLSPASS